MGSYPRSARDDWSRSVEVAVMKATLVAERQGKALMCTNLPDEKAYMIDRLITVKCDYTR